MRISVFTGSRADRSTLSMVAQRLQRDHECELITIDGIERQDGPQSIAVRSAMVMNWLGFAMDTLKPDIAVLHGDRWDAAAAALAFHVSDVPIAHIGGGDRTTGSYDDAMRDSITMLAQLHFPTSLRAAVRIGEAFRRLDRAPDSMLLGTINEPSVEWLMDADIPPLSDVREKFEETRAAPRFALVNWQPETMADDPNEGLFNLLQALDDGPAMSTIVIGPNIDRGADHARKFEKLWCEEVPNRRVFYPDVDRIWYAALMKHCAVMIGNSSSGVIEAPHLGTPVVNIGQRQNGRELHGAIYADSGKIRWIKEAIAEALLMPRIPRATLSMIKSEAVIEEALQEFERRRSIIKAA